MHPLRSMLTILGIFIGVASGDLVVGDHEGIADKANSQIEELGRQEHHRHDLQAFFGGVGW